MILKDQLGQEMYVSSATIIVVNAVTNNDNAWKQVKSADSLFIWYRKFRNSGQGSKSVDTEVHNFRMNGARSWEEFVKELTEQGEFFDQHDTEECTRELHGVVLNPSFS